MKPGKVGECVCVSALIGKRVTECTLMSASVGEWSGLYPVKALRSRKQLRLYVGLILCSYWRSNTQCLKALKVLDKEGASVGKMVRRRWKLGLRKQKRTHRV